MKIEFNNVDYSYSKKGTSAIKDINLSLDKNEIIFILGATGSGKSTLVQHMNGLLYSKSGVVKVETGDNVYIVNKKLRNIKDVRRSVGMVFQSPENQLFENTVLDDVMYGPLNFGVDEVGAKTSAVESLESMNIDESYHQKSPFKLSGGEKRKVAIAGVLACKPQVLIFDEPTSNLDNKSTREFFDLIQELKNQGHMIIIISHNENLAYEYADRILIMAEGNIIFDGNHIDAFKDKIILDKANIEIPFVAKVKERFELTQDVRNIKELAALLGRESL